MIKTAEINERLLEDLPVIRLPKVLPPGAGLSMWWMEDDRITFQVTSADTALTHRFCYRNEAVASHECYPLLRIGEGTLLSARQAGREQVRRSHRAR